MVVFTIQLQKLYRHTHNVAIYTDHKVLAGISVAFLVGFQFLMGFVAAVDAQQAVFPIALFFAYVAGLWGYWYQHAKPNPRKSVVAQPANNNVPSDQDRKYREFEKQIRQEHLAALPMIRITYPDRLLETDLRLLRDNATKSNAEEILTSIEKRRQRAELICYYDHFLINDATYPHQQFQQELDQIKDKWEVRRHYDAVRKLQHKLQDHVRNRPQAGKKRQPSVGVEQFHVDLRRHRDRIRQKVESDAVRRGIKERHLIEKECNNQWRAFLKKYNLNSLMK